MMAIRGRPGPRSKAFDGPSTRRRRRTATSAAPTAPLLAPDALSSGSDQALSDADQTSSAADQLTADSDQRSSDRDQAASDREHDAASDLSAADERAYDSSRDAREAATDQRTANQVERTNTTHEREATGRFRAVLDAGPNGVVATDARGVIVYANAHLERMFGHEVGALVGRPIDCLVVASTGPGDIEHRRTLLDEPVPREMGLDHDLMGQRQDGSEFPVDVSLTPIETNDGLQVFATVIDITARKRAESRLLHAQKLESIGRLAAGIAHDFNNMLFAIQGYANILTDDLERASRDGTDLGDAVVSVDAISLATERAANLTAQLLAFSRHQVVASADLDLNAAIRTIEPLLRQVVGKGIRLRVALVGGPTVIHADPGWIDQVVVNLVVNARDAMPDGGKVLIETGRLDLDEATVLCDVEVQPGSYVSLTVADTGIGIDPGVREQIFEPYFTTKEFGKGTGLGLATTLGIVSQAGGFILVTSEPGQGASFQLLFPRVQRGGRKRPSSRTA
jgi:PAS domain S-box-containing protein